MEQVEELWQCLVVRGTSECADCLYSWLLSHTKSPEQHALGLDALRFLYIEKMPTLDPEVSSCDKFKEEFPIISEITLHAIIASVENLIF